MKKIVLVFGLISGVISSVLMSISMSSLNHDCNSTSGMVVGFASMILAFSLIFVAVKVYRDKHNGGIVSFKNAFLMGLYISLITSTMYVASWAVVYNYSMPDFMDKYSAAMIRKLETSGEKPAEIKEEIAKIEKGREDYKNPVYFTLITYTEILPVGIIISLICAGILKRKKPENAAPAGI
jgi:hypothetical protein